MSFVNDCVSLSRQHLAAGYLAEAETSCRTALSAAPNDSAATHLLGIIALHANRPHEAGDLFERAIELNSDVPEFHNSRGVLQYGCRDFAAAEDSFRRAVDLNPNHAPAQNNLGNALRALGRHAEAEACFRHAIELRPNYSEAFNNLGNTLREMGELDEAEVAFRQSLSYKADNLDCSYNLGCLLLQTGRLDEAGRHLASVLAADPSRSEAAIALGQVFQGQNRTEDAVHLLSGVHKRDRNNEAVLFALQLLRSTQIPQWHIPMINDHERNDAYETALKRAIKPGDTVLEIGTGSALVAMMAARAGARHVYTCEMHKPLVDVARETITRNGYGDKITVISKRSTDMRVGADMPEKADVFVSELINVGMLAPDMLPILQHARHSLVKPGGKILPMGATVYGMLIQADSLRQVAPIRNISGFDMSRFDQFRTPGYQVIDLAAEPHTILSEPFVAWEFDFTRTAPDMDMHALEAAVVASGTAHGVAFWFDLHLDEETTYSSLSSSRTNHWKQAVYFFGRDLKVTDGQIVNVGTSYDRTQIHFFL